MPFLRCDGPQQEVREQDPCQYFDLMGFCVFDKYCVDQKLMIELAVASLLGIIMPF